MENITKYTFYVMSNRVDAIVKTMPVGKVEVFDPSADGTTKITVTLANDTDALLLFHSGIEVMLDRIYQ